MVFAFDTLSYARYLRERGISQDHAEAHAEAARQFIMAELVTKADLTPLRADLSALRQELTGLRQDLTADLAGVKNDLIERFDAKLENLSLRLTVRLGVMLAAAVALLTTLLKLT